MKARTMVFTALILAAVSACKKKENAATPSFDGSITITSLHDHDTIHGGTSFTVVGSATANTEMHGYDLQLQDPQGNVLQDYPSGDHSTSYSFNQVFTHTYTDTTNLQLEVLVVEDHDGNMLTKTIPFVFVP